MDKIPQKNKLRSHFACALFFIFFTILIAAHLAFLARTSSEAVRVRNALLLTPESLELIEWHPPNYPPYFKTDTLPPDPRFIKVVSEIGADQGSDFDRALKIAGHLTENAKDLGPIQSNTWTAYQKIRQGKGYCSDFIQAYIGLAQAAGIIVREWGFSFDGFGGQGHAVLEVYDRQVKKWIFLDIYNNFHATSRDALSVAELRDAFLHNPDSLKFSSNGPGRLGFVQEKALREYYQRGINGWFLIQGNNLQAYENSTLVYLFGGISRAAEQAIAILSGVHPRISILETPTNQRAIKAIRNLRSLLLIELPLLAVSFTGLIIFLFLYIQDYRRSKVM